MKALLKLPAKLMQKTHLKIACTLLLGTLLSACGDSVLQSGTAAGDAEEDADIQAAITLLQPYVGVYLLADTWKGGMGDVAYLAIRLTANDGISEAALIDVDSVGNCAPEPFSTGVVQKDDFSDRVFMNDLFEFGAAVLSLSGPNLLIQNFTDLATVEATRIETTELDLDVACP